MKVTVALAAFLLFAASAFGQGAQQPNQNPPAQTVPVSPQRVIPDPQRPRAGVVLIPNWPADKPAPIILIPTLIKPPRQAWVTLVPGVVLPTRPCAIYAKNGRAYQFLEGTLPGGMQAKKRSTRKDIDKVRQAGGDVKILSHSATPQEIEAARASCGR